MLKRHWSIIAVCSLAACGAEAPAPEPAATATPGAEAASEMPVMGPERRILAFGDSLFAGYNLDQGESYPARLEAALRARGINARVSNAGVSGDTTAAARQRLAFTLDAQDSPPELVIVEFGGNDLLRNLPPAETRANLAAMLDELAKRDIPVLLMGMRAPPNLGADFQREFDGIYPALAKEYGAALVPFFIESFYDQPQLIQSDRIHPTADGVETLVRATVDDVAEALPPAE
ncbi:MAG: arylesterase [Allopontixanthobacter sediminis]